MCNGKGWSVAYDGERYWIEQHFCRVFGDCYSVDRPRSEAVLDVIAALELEATYETDETRLEKIRSQLSDWRSELTS